MQTPSKTESPPPFSTNFAENSNPQKNLEIKIGIWFFDSSVGVKGNSQPPKGGRGSVKNSIKYCVVL